MLNLPIGLKIRLIDIAGAMDMLKHIVEWEDQSWVWFLNLIVIRIWKWKYSVIIQVINHLAYFWRQATSFSF